MNQTPPVKLLSCDTHLEHWSTVLTDYVPQKFHEILHTAPYAVRLWNQLDCYGPNGIMLGLLSGHGRFTQVTKGEIDPTTQKIPGAYGGPDEYVGWLDEDGVTAAVLVPGTAIGSSIGAVRGTRDHDGYIAFLQGYNNYLSEFCSAYPDRLLGGALIPATGIEDALAELRRVRKLPGICTIAPGAFPNGSACPQPEDDRFWAECLELDMPITLHGGISSPVNGLHSERDVATWVIGQIDMATGGPFSAAQLILSGVFDRLPDLRFLITECGAGWLPYMQDTMDHMYDRHRYWAGIDLKNPPSWYCTSGNILWNIIADHTAIKLRDDIGVANLTWASDFPHSNSEYPWSRLRALELTRGVPATERHDILWGNAARFYRIEK